VTCLRVIATQLAARRDSQHAQIRGCFAALARICAALEPSHSVPLLMIAGVAWAGAFPAPTARGYAFSKEDRFRTDIIERIMCDLAVDLSRVSRCPAATCDPQSSTGRGPRASSLTAS
jgi:hypothetical protein